MTPRVSRRGVVGGMVAVPMLGPLTARAQAGGSLTRYVDPFIGTDGTGHTFPGPCRPFGMIQPGPDNADTGWDYTSGYQYRAPRILGFSQTRASGTGIPELGDVLLQPCADPRDDLSSAYDKASEVARPGYYAVRLTENQCFVELTCSLRVALHRYRFGRAGRVHVLVDTHHRLRFLEDARVTAASVSARADGVDGTIDSSNWTTRTMAFALDFDRPVASVRELPKRPGQIAPRFLLGFDVGDDGLLQARVALSTIDVDGARANMAEVADWDFDAVARAADAEWGELLGRIEIDTDETTRRIFYTALYHLMLQPSTISDLDGRYRGATGAVSAARGRAYYSTLSLWDTFRAAHPLYTLLAPERVDDFVLTLLDHHRAQGHLPLWPIWGRETWCMIGNPALPVIADAWTKGFRGFDGAEALAAMIKTSKTNHRLADWDAVERYGYYPNDLFPNEAVSRTLEAGIGDAATAHMAMMAGDGSASSRFAARAASYRNLVDPETRLARGRDRAGAWRTPFDPLQTTSPLGTPGDYTEANAWQYSWTPALHDVDGLIAAMGGRRNFTAMLDRFFSLTGAGDDPHQGQEGLIGQYAHGNEPSHHIAWLYAYSDRPERGPELVNEIARRFYNDTPRGITGNDDCGQMSAWYVFATLGFYPGDPFRGHYVLGQPLVRAARVGLASGRSLAIETSSRSPAGTALNDNLVAERTLPHSRVIEGGRLVFSGRRAS
jgi:predicted alpha-1,2-mannosidase